MGADRESISPSEGGNKIGAANMFDAMAAPKTRSGAGLADLASGRWVIFLRPAPKHKVPADGP